MATRWSPCVAIARIARRPRCHAPAVWQLLDRGADGVQAGHHGRDPVRLLDAQLRRAPHLAPRRGPSACRAAAARRSARRRPSRRSSRAPADRRRVTRMSPTGSPACTSRTVASTSAPARRRTSSSAVRVGFRPTSVTVTSASGCSAAATSHGAADETSPGTTSDSGDGLAGPSTAVTEPSRRTPTPAAASIRSV